MRGNHWIQGDPSLWLPVVSLIRTPSGAALLKEGTIPRKERRNSAGALQFSSEGSF